MYQIQNQLTFGQSMTITFYSSNDFCSKNQQKFCSFQSLAFQISMCSKKATCQWKDKRGWLTGSWLVQRRGGAPLLSDGSNRTRRNSMELSHRRVRLDARKGFCTTGWSGTGKVKAEARLKNNELTERKHKGTTNTLSFLLLLFKNSKEMLYCLNNWLCFQTVQNQTH